MVVIEPVSVKKEEPKPSTTASSAAAEPSGYDSDGYETASDTQLNEEFKNPENDATESTDTLANGDDQKQPQPNDHELNEQRALAQANEAKLEGNTLFKEGRYEEALLKYDLALQVASDFPTSAEIRSICHANRGACFSKLGSYKETVKECTKALELNPSYTKALIRRGEAHEKLENYEEAIADMTKILELDPSYGEARRTIIRLKPLADEKREKMKEEMIGKLKEMGNSVLGRFGMSVDNFKAVKDPNTGSYSISFQR